MLATPELSQIPFDAMMMGGIGYAIGHLAEANTRLWAAILAIASLANHIFFQAASYWLRPRLNLSSESIYAGTNLAVMATTVLVVRELELISRRMAGILIFASLGILAARLKVIAD